MMRYPLSKEFMRSRNAGSPCQLPRSLGRAIADPIGNPPLGVRMLGTLWLRSSLVFEFTRDVPEIQHRYVPGGLTGSVYSERELQRIAMILGWR